MHFSIKNIVEVLLQSYDPEVAVLGLGNFLNKMIMICDKIKIISFIVHFDSKQIL